MSENRFVSSVFIINFVIAYDFEFTHYFFSLVYITQTTGGHSIAPKSVLKVNKGYFNSQEVSENTIWTRDRLQLAKIRKSPCSSQSCRGAIWHGLRSPISFWNCGWHIKWSSNSSQKDAHENNWVQILNWWRILVFKSIHTAHSGSVQLIELFT